MKLKRIALYTLYLHSILLCVLLVGLVHADEKKGRSDPETAAAIQTLYADLEKAIQTRDYSVFRSNDFQKKPLTWHTPNEPNIVDDHVTFAELAEKLSVAAKNAKIVVNEKVLERFGIVTVETEGWPGKYPFVYFNFSIIGNKLNTWRWVGARQTLTKDVDGDELHPDWELGRKLLPGLMRNLKKACASKDFTVLKQYVPKKKLYFWGQCGPGDMGPDEFYYEEMTEILLHDSKNAEIFLNPEPNMSDIGGDGQNTYAFIDTDGWANETPFISFSFTLLKKENRWVWNGVCSDVLPPVQENNKMKRVYFRKPKLPRTGPRIFQDSHSLKARIEEILQFRELAALKVYAVKNKLIFGRCSYQEIEADHAVGKEVSVETVISFLKEKAAGASNIRRSNVSYKKTYETIGWNGEYPYVTFWITESGKGWEWSGVSYCKSNRIEVIQNQGDTFFGGFRWIRKIFQ